MLSKTLRALALAALALAAFGSLTAATAADGLRPEVGKPLQQAADLLKAGKAKEALAKVHDAEAVPNRTPSEQLTIDRMKAAAAQRAGDTATAIRALEAVYPKTSGAEQGQIAEQLAALYAQQHNNAKAGEWLNRAIQAGNNSAAVKQMQTYLLSASGDYAAIARDAGAAVAAAEQAGRRPEEADLLRLADAQQHLGNSAANIATLEKLVVNYPKKDYWNAYLGRLPRKPGFADRFALDVLRLRMATGTLGSADDYMVMAQLALQAGLPAEALRVVDQGYKAGLLGSGAEASRQQRLRDLAIKQEGEQKAALANANGDALADKTGDDLVKLGYALVSVGEVDPGIALIGKGIAKGDLKHPEDAKLRLGMAQLQSAKSRSAATQTLRSVKGKDGAADIAHLWLIVGNP